MELQTLKATTRQAAGKSGARGVRVSGAIPCILYGGEAGSVSLQVNARQFEQLIHHNRSGEHAIVQLEVEDNAGLNTPALLKAVQHHPIRGQAVHADFLRIRLDEKITTVVPVKLVGHAPGITEGGVVDHQCRELEVECLALDLPDAISIDVSSLHMGQSIHVADVKVLDRITVLTESDRVVVAIHAPRAAKEAVEGEEGAAEPEVITERKKEEAPEQPKKK